MNIKLSSGNGNLFIAIVLLSALINGSANASGRDSRLSPVGRGQTLGKDGANQKPASDTLGPIKPRVRRTIGGGQLESFSMEATGLGDLEEADAIRKMLRRRESAQSNHDPLIRGSNLLGMTRQRQMNFLKRLTRSSPGQQLNLERPKNPQARHHQVYAALNELLTSKMIRDGRSSFFVIRRRGNRNGNYDNQEEVLQYPLPFGGQKYNSEISFLTMRKIPGDGDASLPSGPRAHYSGPHRSGSDIDGAVDRDELVRSSKDPAEPQLNRLRNSIANDAPGGC